MIASVDSNRTIAIFVHGIEMTMSSLGHVTTVNRTGWQATTFAGKVPGQPVPTPPGSLGPELRQLEAIGGQPSDADNAAKTSGLFDQNSGLGPGGGGRQHHHYWRRRDQRRQQCQQLTAEADAAADAAAAPGTTATRSV